MRALECNALSDDLSGVRPVDRAPPTAGRGEAVVRILAAGVTFPDLLMCQGKYQFRPEPPFVPGTEACGRIEALGDDVADLRVGDVVHVSARMGLFAQYVVAARASLRPKPAALTTEQTAAFGSAYATAHLSLVRRARLEAGETLLVHGAAGGVGLAAVDMGKRLGATVIATASTEVKRTFLREYGADHVLPSSGFRDAVKDLTSGRGADVTFDPVGGDVFDESVRCIAFGGRLLVIGFAGGRIATVATNMPLIKGFSIVGVRAGEYARQFPAHAREDRAALWALAGAGAIRPHVHAVRPLAEGRDALLSLNDRTVIGRVLLQP